MSPYAAKSRDAIRDIEEEPDPLRTAFQRDRDRIIHSKCFRRLKHKTQVYIAPGDHYRTRMTHTLEVGQIGRTVARALRLNEDLVEAIAMGHDVGHTPFGHVGEYALRDMVGHFNHNEQSLRMVEVLERHGDHTRSQFNYRCSRWHRRSYRGYNSCDLRGSDYSYCRPHCVFVS